MPVSCRFFTALQTRVTACVIGWLAPWVLLTGAGHAWAGPTAVLPRSGAGTASSPQDTSQTAATRVDSVLRRVVRANEPGIAAVVVSRGRTVFRGAVGMADLTRGVPMQANHRFAVGSVTKSLTAAAFLTLVEEGRIALDTPLSTYLPDYPSGGRLTARQLLSHTSGIPDLLEMAPYMTRIRDEVTLQDLVGFFRDEPLASEPGTRWAYSNSGYYVLELLIERVTGLSWEEFLTQRVLAPSGMVNTIFARDRGGVPDLAHGYRKVGAAWENPLEMSYSHLRAAGGLITDLDDLVRFQAALFGGRLLARGTVDRMLEPTALRDGTTAAFGLGWFLGDLAGRRTAYHGGYIFGYVAHMLYLPSDSLFVALLSNREDRLANPGMQRLAEAIALAALGPPPEARPRQAVALPLESLRRLAGEYRIAGGGPGAGTTRAVVLEDGSLFYDQGQGRRTRMLAESDTLFFFQGAVSLVTFAVAPDGSVTGMVLHQGGIGGRRIVFARVR